jgi:hypothetical protein
MEENTQIEMFIYCSMAKICLLELMIPKILFLRVKILYNSRLRR